MYFEIQEAGDVGSTLGQAVGTKNKLWTSSLQSRTSQFEDTF